MSGVGPARSVGLLLRSLLIQGAWNYGTMLGAGFAFVLLPVLRQVHSDDPEELSAALERQAKHFNAHPYLASVALGAVVRLESDGADGEMVNRFRTAVRGPLGGLGDTLVWATWLPLVAVCALVLYWFGVRGWVVVATFVAVYNVGHLGLRAWGLRLGLEAGRDVGKRLTEADLGGWARRLQGPLVLGIGILTGAIIGAPDGLASLSPVVTGLAVGAFLAGLLVGHRAWRPAAAVTVVVVGFIGAWGFII